MVVLEVGEFGGFGWSEWVMWGFLDCCKKRLGGNCHELEKELFFNSKSVHNVFHNR